MGGVVASWLVGAAGGLAALPYAWALIALPMAFAVFLGVALWNAGQPQKGRWREGPTPVPTPADILAVMERYRLRWLALLTVVVSVIAVLNAFSLPNMVLAVTGESVTAHVVLAQSRDGFTECALARPDGTSIPGRLRVDGTQCPDPVDVKVDPMGLIDPALKDEATVAKSVLAMVLFVSALALCVPTARPRPTD